MLPPDPRDRFAATYARVHGPFTRYCAARCLGADAGTLDDVVQAAVLGALERQATVPEADLMRDDRLLAYLIGTARRQLRDRLRHGSVRERYARERRRVLGDRLPADPDAAVELALVLEAIDRLPDADRDVLLLRGVSDLSLREIARQQGCSEAAAKVRLHRARKRLQRALASDHAGAPVDVAAALSLLAALLAV